MNTIRDILGWQFYLNNSWIEDNGGRDMLKSPSEQQAVNVFFFFCQCHFFVNIDIVEHSCCPGWASFCPFPSGLLVDRHMDPIRCVPIHLVWAKLCVGGQQLSLQLQLYLFPQPNPLAVMSITFTCLHEKPLYTFATLSGVRWRCRLTKTSFNRKSQVNRLLGKAGILKEARLDGKSQSDMQINKPKKKIKPVSICTNTLARTAEEYLEFLSFCQGVCILSGCGLLRWR